jgi:integrase
MAARPGETIGAKENEFDLKDRVWTVPEGRIKGEKEHKVPLSDAVVAILQSLPRERRNPFVFIGPEPAGCRTWRCWLSSSG